MNDDLMPEQMEELIDWFAGFFRYLKADPAATQEWKEHPGRALGKYRRRVLKERRRAISSNRGAELRPDASHPGTQPAPYLAPFNAD